MHRRPIPPDLTWWVSCLLLPVWLLACSGSVESTTCGDGILQQGETCDPPSACPTNCEDGNPCTSDLMTGSAQNCNASCSHSNISQCLGGDGCCPAGCNSGNDSDCSPSCGNQVADPGETCGEPSLPACPTSCDDGNSCTSDLMTGSAQNCNASCSHSNISQCLGGDGCCPAGCNIGNDSDCIANPIVVYDIRHLPGVFRTNDLQVRMDVYDRMLAIQTVQGIVNRDQPRLFLDYVVGFENFNMNPSGNTINFDQQWFERLCAPSSPDLCISVYPALHNRVIIRLNESSTPVDTLIHDYFSKSIQGIVAWDERVSATSNAAVSIAGARSWVAARYSTENNSVLARLLTNPSLTIGENLFSLDFTDIGRIPEYPSLPTTQSRKNNLYRWLVEKYLKTGLLNPDHFGYYVDAFAAGPSRIGESLYITGTSHFDWSVKNKALVFDLSMWGDEVACDERDLADPPPAGADRQTFIHILSSASSISPRLKAADGFLPWPWKYSTWQNCGGHEPWHGEHEEVNLFSEHGVVFANTDAESEGWDPKAIGVMPNASFYSCLASSDPRRFLNDTVNPPPSQIPLENKTYLLFGLGDYDAASWTYKMLLSTSLWRNAVRGQVPLLWEINPVVFESNPVLLDELIATRTAKDYFGALEGFGYINANLFPDDKKAILQETAQSAFSRLNYTITAFYIFTDLIRGADGTLSDPAKGLLMSFSGDGLGMSDSPAYATNSLMTGSMYDQMGVPASEAHAYIPFGPGCLAPDCWAAYLNDPQVVPQGTPQFAFIRTVFVSPEQIQQIVNILKTTYNSGRNWEIVDPYTYYRLLRQSLGKINDYRTTYLSDNVPSQLNRQTHTFQVSIRNDGWNAWDPACISFGYSFVPKGQPHTYASYDARGRFHLPQIIQPGATVALSFNLNLTESPGSYSLQMDMVNEGPCLNNTWFREQHDNPWTKTVEVIP